MKQCLFPTMDPCAEQRFVLRHRGIVMLALNFVSHTYLLETPPEIFRPRIVFVHSQKTHIHDHFPTPWFIVAAVKTNIQAGVSQVSYGPQVSLRWSWSY